MKSSYRLCFVALLLGLMFSCKKENAGSQIDLNTVQHPQILLLEGQETQIEDLIASDPVWTELHSVILKESNKILGKSLLQRKLTGRRLLRACLEVKFHNHLILDNIIWQLANKIQAAELSTVFS